MPKVAKKTRRVKKDDPKRQKIVALIKQYNDYWGLEDDQEGYVEVLSTDSTEELEDKLKGSLYDDFADDKNDKLGDELPDELLDFAEQKKIITFEESDEDEDDSDDEDAEDDDEVPGTVDDDDEDEDEDDSDEDDEDDSDEDDEDDSDEDDEDDSDEDDEATNGALEIAFTPGKITAAVLYEIAAAIESGQCDEIVLVKARTKKAEPASAKAKVAAKKGGKKATEPGEDDEDDKKDNYKSLAAVRDRLKSGDLRTRKARIAFIKKHEIPMNKQFNETGDRGLGLTITAWVKREHGDDTQ